MSARRSAIVLLALLVACPADDDTIDPPDTDTEDTDVVDSTPDTDDSDDTTEGPPPQLDAAWWGGGLVDVSAALRTPDAVVIDPGRIDGEVRAPTTATAFFADLDGDGRPELVTGRSTFGVDGTVAHRVYQWTVPDGLVEDAALTALVDHGPEAWLGAADLDGDGHLDLVSGRLDAAIAWGDGSGGFGDPQPLDVPVSWGTAAGLGWWDVDRDGWLDLVVGERGCEGTAAFLMRTGPRTFTPRTELLGEDGPPGRTDFVLPLLHPDGRDRFALIAPDCPDVAANPGFLAPGAPVGLEEVTHDAADLLPANSFWKLDPAFAGQPFTALMPMGGTQADLDDDGLLDLMLTVGTRVVPLFHGQPDGSWVDGSTTAHLDLALDGTDRLPWIPWGIEALDLDRDGRKDVVVAIGDDATSYREVRGERTHSLAFWQGDDGVFLDVTEAVGLDVLGSWHGLVADDVDGDGDPDLALAGYGAPTRAWRNDIDAGMAGFSLVLQGAAGNPLALGARVRVVVGDVVQHHLVGAVTSPEGQGRRPIFVGLGEASQADRVEITWPAGWTQVLEDVVAGQRHVVTEPPLVIVQDADRHLPADGTSRVSVQILPRDASGALDSGAEVAVRLVGAGTVAPNPPLWSGFEFLTEVVAPDTPGEARLEILVDGEALPLRPRFWFDAVPP